MLGTIAIPRIGLDAHLQQGIALAAIDRGPGHWPGTAMPGELGNVVVAGHRTTYTAAVPRPRPAATGRPGRVRRRREDLDLPPPGAIVIVPADAVDIAAQSYAHTATLFACHPPGQATQRIVAKLRLLDATGAPGRPRPRAPPIERGQPVRRPRPHRRPAALGPRSDLAAVEEAGPVGLRLASRRPRWRRR